MEDTNEIKKINNAESLEEKFAKKSKEINYSTTIFENQPQINFYKVEEERQDGTIENTGVFILKYEINGIQQEAIIGKLKNTNRAFEKAKDIKELIENQLRENSKSSNNLNNFNQLKKFVTLNNLPFELTMEGSDIITYTGRENISVRRTYYEKTSEDKNSKIKCLYSPEEMLEFARERKINNKELFCQIENNKKWNKNRVVILKILTNKENQKEFLKGEKIANLVETTDEKLILQNYKELIVEYLKESYEKDGNSEILEKIQEKTENDILEKSKKGFTEREEIDNNRTLNTLKNYSRFFDLIKTSRNVNARIAAKKLYRIDFSVMKKLFERVTNDKELIKYIELKGKSINDIEEQDNKKSQINEDKESILFQRDMKFDYYQNNESVRDLYNFLVKSSSREHKDTEKIVPVLQNLIEVSDEELKNQLEGNNKTEIDDREQR